MLTRRFPSKSQENVWYKTDVHNGAGVCSCRGFTSHGHCWHVNQLIEEEKSMTQDTEERAVVKHEEAPQPLALTIPPRSLPTTDELSVMGKIAQTLVQARGHSVPKEIDSAAKAAAVLLAGWEVGLKPMTAFRHIFVVNGRTELDSQAMMGLVKARDPSAEFIFHTYTAELCDVELRRGGERVVRVTYSMKDAGLSGQTAKGGPWKQYPRDMCAWAAVKRACRLGAPDLVNAIPPVLAEEAAADLLQEEMPGLNESVQAGRPVWEGDPDAYEQERDAEFVPEPGQRRYDAQEEAAYAEAEAEEEARQAEMAMGGARELKLDPDG